MPNGYSSVMRRSVQTVLLFEAQRCVREKIASMRPFQRKIALYNQLCALLNTLDFIPSNDRKEVLWRTGTSKEAMNDEGKLPCSIGPVSFQCHKNIAPKRRMTNDSHKWLTKIYSNLEKLPGSDRALSRRNLLRSQNKRNLYCKIMGG